jgi:beta-glucosidase
MSSRAPITLTGRDSIPEVVQAMTLEEKARFVAGAKAFQTCAIERLGIPAIVLADGHNGITFTQLMGNLIADVLARQGRNAGGLHELMGSLSDLGMAGLSSLAAGQLDEAAIRDLPPDKAAFFRELSQAIRDFLPAEGLPSCFPPGIVMGATWNSALVGECGRAVAKEARAFGVDMLLGPNVNIHRSPLGGRVFESYSEDPYLAAQTVIDYVRGVQSQGIAADVKHFAANNQEYQRQGIDEIISERALREIYLPAFKAAVQEGGCWTVMSAYNKINGADCALNHRLLTEILRQEWGFEGFVVSDWGAAYDRVQALLAGNDLEMPGPQDPQVIVDAVARGDLPEAVLDERVANILGVLVRLPAFQRAKRTPLDRAFSARVARQVAVEGAVLLKNENRALPLGGQGVLAVLGDNARKPISTGTGSAGVMSPYVVSLAEGLEARFGPERVCWGEIPPHAGAVIVSIGLNCGEGQDRESLALPEPDVALIRRAAQQCRRLEIASVVVLNVCGPVEMHEWIDEVDAVLLIWLGGMELGHAAAALLAGDENPSGKLPLTFPRRYRDTPAFLHFPGEFGEVRYGEDIYVGYRYYDAKGVAPQFPFGYGLSYTRFELSNLRLSAETLDLDASEALTVSVDVTNAGERKGQEVVQLYIADLESTPHRPPKELKGFAKVEVAPGETETVRFTVDRRALQHYDPLRRAWCVEPGLFGVLIGTSSADIRLQAEFKASGFNPYGLGPQTPIARVMADPRAVAVLQKHLPGGEMSSAALELDVTFTPQRPLDQLWAQRVEPALQGQPPQERAALKERVYQELAAIEV